MRNKLTFLFLFTLFIQTVNAQNVDSLKQLLPKASREKRIELYNKLSEYTKEDLPDSSLFYSKKSLELSILAEDELNIGISHKNSGNALNSLRKYEDALVEYTFALQIFSEIKNENQTANTLELIGRVYEGLNKFSDAINNYQKSLTIFEKIKDQSGISLVLNDIGAVYIALKNFPKAIEYLEQSLVIREKSNDLYGTSVILNNIGIIYDSMGNPEKALEYYNKSLKINEQLGNQQVVAYLLHNIGILYENKQQYKEAKQNYLKSLEISKELGDDYGTSYTLSHLGVIARETKDYDEALSRFSESLGLATKISNKEVIYQTYLEYSKTYKILGNPIKALEYHELYSDVKDSVFNEDMQKQIAEMEAKFNSDKKEKENQLLRKDKELNQAQIKRQNLINIGIGIVLFLVIILAFVFILSNNRRRKANIKLEKQNIEISQQKEEIESQTEQLLTYSKELEKLSIVASETDNAIVIMDEKGEFIWQNEGFTRLYGFTLEEIKEKNKDIYSTSSNPKIKSIVENCITLKESAIYESNTISKNGEQIWVQTTITPIFDTEEKLTKIIAIDTDIRKVKEAELLILKQKDELQQKNELINGSIRYAQTIQNTILPNKKLIDLYFENFIIYLPKDIVSGDFYWFNVIKEEEKEIIFFSVVDCTGHGVPGAFMSMIGNRLLHDIVNERRIFSPKEILMELDISVRKTLQQEQSDNHDGMDLAICSIEKTTNGANIIFSGAKSPFRYFSSNKKTLVTVKGDKKTIGGNIGRNHSEFTNTEVILENGDLIYLSTDGFIDQNNKERKRFGSDRLEKLLEEIGDYKPEQQREKLLTELNQWIENESQRDDIAFVGIKI